MAQLLNDRRDVQFVLHDQLNISSLTKDPRFSDLNKKTFDMVVSEARNLAVKEMVPSSIEGDQQGCSFDAGEVKMPEVYHSVYKLLKEGEWIALSDDLDVGGQGMPQVIKMAVDELFQGANTCLALAMGLTHGAGKLIEVFGTDEQKKTYLEKLYSGEWSGTMALTEPDAGSEVGALTTTAVKNDDGTYYISGNKVFISQSEGDLTDNIINPVLARIEGAPAGTKGISLFIVPKYLVNEDGSLGERNDYVCTGIEEKIGIHGSSTCSLTFGSKGKCVGFLLGKENDGIRTMFHMMNEARLFVAMQALGLASTSFLYALNYARERVQGRRITELSNPDADQVAIIEHPDVRRMLMWMKSNVEGLRSLNYYVGLCVDQANNPDVDKEEKARLDGIIAVLIPVCKAHTTERGCEICTMGIQVYGGAGACREYPVEQLLRDIQISTIYEGTTGIQGLDFLGRKLGMKKGAAFKSLLDEINKTITAAKDIPEINNLAVKVEEALGKYQKTVMTLGKAAASEKVLDVFAQACPILEVTGDLCIAWMLLWRASIAAPKLTKILKNLDADKQKEKVAKHKDAPFYHGQLKTAAYFINDILPVACGKLNAIEKLDSSIADMTDAAFGGK